MLIEREELETIRTALKEARPLLEQTLDPPYPRIAKQTEAALAIANRILNRRANAEAGR